MREDQRQTKSMRTSTPRAPRRNGILPVKTIDIFKQPRPIAHADMGYSMSIPAPLQDPSAYAANISKLESSSRQANRIPQPLAPTYEETEAFRNDKTRIVTRKVEGDPLVKLSNFHNLEAFKASMNVAGFPAEQYQARRVSRASVPVSSGDITVMGDSSMNATSLVTPLRRAHEGPQGSTAKRQRTSSSADVNSADVSSDTIKSVLRLVDESLVDTPERKPVVTPKVLRAVPGPSPRENGPRYAYSASVQQNNYCNLFPSAPSVLTPFSITRL